MTVSVKNGISFELLPIGQIARLVYVTDFELHERDFISKSLKFGMNVINVGANVGLYAILTSKLISESDQDLGEGGLVLAFEPSSSTFGILASNIEINDCVNIIPLQLGVANKKGSLVLKSDITDLSADGHRALDVFLPHHDISVNDEVVEVVTLDEYLTSGENDFKLAIANIDFVIIDVEGGELDVLLGAKAVLEQSSNLTIMIELTKDIEMIVELLTGIGFKFYTWNRWIGALIECDVFEASKKGNIIAQRK